MYATHPKFQFRDAGPTCLLLSCEGGLSWEDRDMLTNEVERYLYPRPGVRDLAIDMSAVRFVNSAGLGALFQLYRRIRQRGGRVVFANVPAVVGRVFNAVGLDRLAQLVPDVPAAFQALGISATLPAGSSPMSSQPHPQAATPLYTTGTPAVSAIPPVCTPQVSGPVPNAPGGQRPGGRVCVCKCGGTSLPHIDAVA